MIRPGSRIDMVQVLPNFERIPYANDLHKNFDLIQKAFIRSARSILLGHDLVYEALEARHHWKIKLYFYTSECWPNESTTFTASNRNNNLWIGPQKFSERQRTKIKKPYGCLRIATFKTTTSQNEIP